ncbi:MAG TPA: hypothetical protein ENM97_02375 [Moorella mulderi]|nr:hypothetical protein [Moorella mulderi]
MEVKMPGKRRQPLDLLSGGEKALTVLAFILALMARNPGCFYLLDEVDTALDEANVNRFAGFLRRFGQENQIIMVTHRTATMMVADRLYGVTLTPEGFSQVCTLDLKELSREEEIRTKPGSSAKLKGKG